MESVTPFETMVTISPFLVVVLLLIRFTSTSDYHQTLATYIASLTKHLASNQTGTFDCWLYHACSDPPGTSGLLQAIAVQLEMQWIPRRIIDSRFPWTEETLNWNRPSLVVIHVEFTSHNPSVLANCGALLGLLDRQTRVLILLSFQSKMISVLTFSSSITTGQLFNVAFLSVVEESMIFPDIHVRRFVRTRKFKTPDEMFPDQSRYLHGLPLRYSVLNGFLNACIGNNCQGFDVTLAKEFARYLNTTPQYVKFVCPYKINKEKDSESNCIYNVTYEPDCPFDIFADSATGEQFIRHYLDKPVPLENVFLAPRGRSLNIAELFLQPFQTELWILFFIGMVTIKLVSLLIPNTFKNDPILLPICGFERFSLNQADRNEKLVMLSLIALFFFISNAYETKIISLMSNKPRVASLATLQDVLNSVTQVKAERFLADSFPMFKLLYSYHDQGPNALDGTSVYLMNGVVGSLLIQRPVNWDYESNQPRYKVMDEKLAMIVGFYPLPVRSALKPHFRFVQKALFESGILSRWRQEWFVQGDLKYSNSTLPGGVNPSSDILTYSDLMPAWFVVLTGGTKGKTTLHIAPE
ncbi:uncharacterized protein LOC120413395 [Culex pipiens pallens]|uniref:uncharacterized protein LOC120413395 n=1 Tax=Culex pipiens pallens TaxID=42434 RepID=UPI0022AA6997|nr:uncharacterized protein LOC120413395 [Culex pipiens pallens]